MEVMPRPRPPHLQRETTRHGRVIWYVRLGKGPRVRLQAVYGTPEFTAEYNAAVSGNAPAQRRGGKAGSLAWLIARYMESSAWQQGLSQATRRQRSNIFLHVVASAGSEPVRAITKNHIMQGRERRAKTPAQARNFLDAMRGLFRWATEAEHVKNDPTLGVKNPPRPKGGGFPAWNEDDVDRYEAKWGPGTKERVWLHVLLYTGLRRGDAVRIGRQHIRDGIATLRTEKSQGAVTVTLPILPALATTLAEGPTGDLSFICGARGEPLTKESFGNMFREACRAAGVEKSAHGVRKIGATRAANNGATVAELEAIFGWSGGGMASLYTRGADRVRLAKSAMGKLTKAKDGDQEKDQEKTSKARPG